MLQYLKISTLLSGDSVFKALVGDLKKGLSEYLDNASIVLKGSGISLSAPPPDYFSLEKNFFSLIFIPITGIGPERRAFYAAVNQCLKKCLAWCTTRRPGSFSDSGKGRPRSFSASRAQARPLFLTALAGLRGRIAAVS